MKPTFSVIIPTLNEEKFVGNLLDSLVAQTKKNFEVIVVDGGSKDKTAIVVNGFKDTLSNLTFLKGTKALLPFQRNLGADQATGEWLVFVDADSVLLPHFFDRAMSFIDQEKPKFFTTWFRPDSEVNKDAFITLLTNFGLEASLSLGLPVAPGPLAIVHRSAHIDVGGYDRDYRFGEDADYGKRLAEAGFEFRILRETLVVGSLRRFRREGTLRPLRTYAIASLVLILTKRVPKFMPGYLMGGTEYKVRRGKSLSLLRKYEKIVKKIIQEIFS